MRLPEKKALVLTDRPSELDSRARKNATKQRIEPLHVLSQFQT